MSDTCPHVADVQLLKSKVMDGNGSPSLMVRTALNEANIVVLQAGFRDEKRMLWAIFLGVVLLLGGKLADHIWPAPQGQPQRSSSLSDF